MTRKKGVKEKKKSRSNQIYTSIHDKIISIMGPVKTETITPL